jgi:putative membrane protein
MSLAKSPKKLAAALMRPLKSINVLLDQAFFIFAGLASLWLAWLVFRESWFTGGWWMVGLFFVVWMIVAYLALPRLHRILSSIYVPNYFIGRTRTADGILCDPVNLAVRGSEGQLHKVMNEAGWSLAEDITPRSVCKMIATVVWRKSYSNAPVLPSFLFGRKQDFAYQQEVNGNPSQRHHVRFWRCPKGWLLPGGHRVDWLAAGTYDRSIGLSLFTFQLTHRIDEDTDIERDHIIQTVRHNTKSVRIKILKNFSSSYRSRHPGGDFVYTDGNLPIMELSKVKSQKSTLQQFGIIMDGTIHDRLPKNHETLLKELWSRRPPQILFGCGLIVIVSLFTIGQMLFDTANWPEFAQEMVTETAVSVEPTNVIVLSTMALSLAIVIIELALAGALLRGSNWARIMLLAVASATIIAESLSITVGRINMAMAFLFVMIGIHIMVVMLFSSDTARFFTDKRFR